MTSTRPLSMNNDIDNAIAFLSTMIANVYALHQALIEIEKTSTSGRIAKQTAEQQILDLENQFMIERTKYKNYDENLPQDSLAQQDPGVKQAITKLTETCSSFTNTCKNLKKKIEDAKIADAYTLTIPQQMPQSSHLTSSLFAQSTFGTLPNTAMRTPPRADSMIKQPPERCQLLSLPPYILVHFFPLQLIVKLMTMKTKQRRTKTKMVETMILNEKCRSSSIKV